MSAEAPLGYCPTCGSAGVARYRHANGEYDQCGNGHTYWAVEAVDHPNHPLCGWVDHPDRHAVAAEFLPLAAHSPRLMQSMPAADPSAPVLLYKVIKEVFGAYPSGEAWPAQQIGDCTSFGHGHANDLGQTIRVYLGDMDAARVHATCTEFIYGAAREVGNMLGPMDGCYGGAVVKAMTTVGVLPRSAVGPYSGDRAKQWGWRGVPDSLKAEASPYKLGSAARVTTWDELVAAVGNGYPVTICSNQGFNSPRDNQGFCRAVGRWPHCMFIAGVRFDRPGACVIQSWGPDQPGGPLDLDQPTNSFWADRRPIEGILAQGDSWALSGFPEFEPQSLPGSWRAA